jgi:hypothetical protein
MLIASCGISSPRATVSAKASNTAGSLAASPTTRVGGFSRVVVLVMENKAFGQIIGNRDAPYINGFAHRYGLALDYHAITHPSLPNYLALLGGSTFDIRSDCTDCHVDATNLVDRLELAGITWKAYMEGMPSPCFTGAVAGLYAKKHNPFMYFDDIAGDPARCSKVVPLDRLDADIANGSMPGFVWITPDQCHDMHDCGVGEGDGFLRRWIPKLLPTLGPDGVLFLTWDESSSYAGEGGGQVTTIVAGPHVPRGYRSTVKYTHYSLLRTILASWHLEPVGMSGCTCTVSMGEFFAPA